MVDNNQVWAVDTPGAPHSAALARQSDYAKTGGVTGIVAASEPDVGTTPGTPMSVRLHPCSVVAASTYAGAYRESYSFAVEESVDVAVDVTGSSSRTDVIAFVVTDPVLEGRDILQLDANGEPVAGSTGIDPRDHDYWEAMRFTNVPTSATGSPEAFRQWAQRQSNIHGPVIPYAYIAQGPNSSTLEGKVRPFFETVLGRSSKVIVDEPVNQTYEVWGRQTSYQTLGPSLNFEVPWWATRARVKANVQGVSLFSEDGAGTIINGRISGLAFGKSMRQYSYYTTEGSAYSRESFMVWADLPVGSSYRGNTTDFRFRVSVNHDGTRLALSGNYASHMFLEVEFLEDPNAVDNSDPELD